MKFSTRNQFEESTGWNQATVKIEGFTPLRLTWRNVKTGLFQSLFQIDGIEFENKGEPEQFRLFLLALHAIRSGNTLAHFNATYEINVRELGRLALAGHFDFACQVREFLEEEETDEDDGAIRAELAGGLVTKTAWEVVVKELHYQSEPAG